MNTSVPLFTVDARLVQVALLAVVRLSGMLAAMPPFNHPYIPVHVRVALAFSLVLPAWGSILATAPPLAPDVPTLVGLAAGDLVIGLTIGFVARLMTVGALAAAELVGIQIGFGLAAVLDPAQGSQITVLARLFDWTMLALFLALNAHHLVIGATVESFRLIPLGGVGLPNSVAAAILPLGGHIFSLALTIVAPTLGILFVTNLVLVLAGRAVPQLNLLSVGFPITVLLGLSVILLNLDAVSGIVAREMKTMESVLITVLRGFADGR